LVAYKPRIVAATVTIGIASVLTTSAASLAFARQPDALGATGGDSLPVVGDDLDVSANAGV